MKKTLIEIQKALKGRALNLSNEKLLQNNIAEAFQDANLDFKKEVKIDENNIVDFMIDTLAIEVKIKSKVSAMNIYRQIERYAKNDKVETILLMTSKTISLPNNINGKPIYILSLGRTQI
ncbi:MAG: hypothetical protein RBT59_12225 [Arcobacteraceae bacterium]|nr:hypothetical protein [Arcobacteraceae bacterium]